jgi:hypothetical protein
MATRRGLDGNTRRDRWRAAKYVSDLNEDGRSDLVVGYPFELLGTQLRTNGATSRFRAKLNRRNVRRGLRSHQR